ncbi:MAG: ATP phosphoribosyltransferase regulatory subunit [Chloroflexota bacterium]|nr:ATP phosphoribosyltransferase regulatory subunit [Chloroflexota bacterium]
MYANSLRSQLPHGLTDLFFEQAALKTDLEDLLREVFQEWGYQRIILPTFEYYDSLATGASAVLKEEMYRFFDREGHTLALRPDMTVPTARVVSTKLYDQPLPLHLYYIGNVFRYEEPQAGRRREFTQAGIELVGADTAEADAEVLAVAIDALRAMNIAQFQINLGQVAFLRGILSQETLSDSDLGRLEQAIQRQNDVELQRTLDELGIENEVARAIRALPRLCGDEGVLEETRTLCTNAASRRAIDRLERVYELLCAEGVGDHVILDLGQVRSMAYYTGITFHGYVEGLGFALCRGGRYDGLIEHFGRAMPAVGFALGVERAMLVTEIPVEVTPDLVIEASDDPACRQLAAMARAKGLRVRMDVLGRHGEALQDYARAIGARRLICCTGNGRYLLIEGDVQRELDLQTVEEEIISWKD